MAKTILTGISPVNLGASFEMQECTSSKPVKTQYLSWEPKFREVFAKYDTQKKGYLDKETVPALVQALNQKYPQGLMQKDIATYDKRIEDAKDCFHKPMGITKITWENMYKDDDDHVTWEKFWEFFTSDKMIERVEKDGLRTFFLAFKAWGIPTYQQQFKALRDRFLAVFVKFDSHPDDVAPDPSLIGIERPKKGYLNQNDLHSLADRMHGVRPHLVKNLPRMDEDSNAKITWGEFWKFLSTDIYFPTTQQELDEVLDMLAILEKTQGEVDEEQRHLRKLEEQERASAAAAALAEAGEEGEEHYEDDEY